MTSMASIKCIATRIGAPLGVVAVVLVAWEITVARNNVSPLVLPSPTAIGVNIVANATRYVADAAVTTREMLWGFLIAFALAFVVAVSSLRWRIVDAAIAPLFAAIRSMPIVAFAPALILLMGYEEAPKIAVAAIVSLPPMAEVILGGLRGVDPGIVDVLRSQRATFWQVLRFARLPHAVPQLLGAARIGIALSLLGAVVGEWVGSASGLGYRIVRAQHDLETTTVWAATVVLSMVGLVFAGVAAFIERRLSHWQRRDVRRTETTS